MTFPVLSANGPSGYNLTNSLRFRSSASANLTRTPASASNRKTWTWSGWVKRGVIGSSSSGFLFTTRGNATDAEYFRIIFNSDVIFISSFNNSALSLTTTAVYRDPSAWYHIVFALDTTQATASNRMKLYVNGVQVTAFSSVNYPAQNADFGINSAIEHGIGFLPINVTGTYFDGYMAEVNFIDGQALTPSSFGSTNAITGVWQPAKYTGTYGTNGFYLPFTNTTSTTTLGNDFSGNGNNWTTNNISLTSGVTYDSMTDVPTLTSATAANYCVLNPIQISGGTLSAANLNLSFSATASPFNTRGTVGASSGKWYYEATMTSSGLGSISIGIKKTSSNTNTAITDGNGWFYYGYSGSTNGIKVNTTGAAYGASFTSGDVIGVAYDVSAGEITFYKNNVSQGVAFTAQSFGEVVPAFYYDGSNTAQSLVVNFGQRPFAYTPPSGFVALNTFNLPSSTIPAGNKFMDATLYTGTSATQTITNSGGMQPDLVWTKSRSNLSNQAWFDSVRGGSKVLFSDLADAEYTGTYISSFNSNGFTIGATPSSALNLSGYTYVAWQWKANGAGVTNTAGSITSTVSANTTSGFSVVTYTGTGANATVGHGLNVAPSMVMFKKRNGTSDWVVYHASVGATAALFLNLTNASITNSVYFNNTAPTSSVLSLGTASAVNDTSSTTHVAYCFTPIAGFSAFGSYTGNGSADGPFIYTGFRPRWVMIKSSSAVGNWIVFDSSRLGYNGANDYLLPNSSLGEGNDVDIDILSNGFKPRDSAGPTNVSGTTYIYVAFAENPTKYALAR